MGRHRPRIAPTPVVPSPRPDRSERLSELRAMRSRIAHERSRSAGQRWRNHGQNVDKSVDKVVSEPRKSTSPRRLQLPRGLR